MKRTLLQHDKLTIVAETCTEEPVAAEILDRIEATLLDLQDCHPTFRGMLARLQGTGNNGHGDRNQAGKVLDLPRG